MNNYQIELMKLKQSYQSELKNITETRSKKNAENISQEFESLLVKKMLSTMTESLEGGSLFGDKPTYDYYQDIFLTQIARKISNTSDLGISRNILENINKNIKNETEEEKSTEPTNYIDRKLKPFAATIKRISESHDLDENLVKAVIIQESNGNPNAVSPVGAKGLMQLMDATADSLNVSNSFDPEENITGGVKYLKKQIENFGSLEKGLAAYNAGPGNVIKYNGIPPFKETQNYVSSVLEHYNNLTSTDKTTQL